jgi:hypothetical protein
VARLLSGPQAPRAWLGYRVLKRLKQAPRVGGRQKLNADATSHAVLPWQWAHNHSPTHHETVPGLMPLPFLRRMLITPARYPVEQPACHEDGCCSPAWLPAGAPAIPTNSATTTAHSQQRPSQSNPAASYTIPTGQRARRQAITATGRDRRNKESHSAPSTGPSTRDATTPRAGGHAGASGWARCWIICTQHVIAIAAAPPHASADSHTKITDVARPPARPLVIDQQLADQPWLGRRPHSSAA